LFLKPVMHKVKYNIFRDQLKQLLPNYRKINVKDFSCNSEFETVFIEFRILEHIEFQIRNIIYKLDSKWSHTIVCGNINFIFIKNMCKSISNKIKIIKLDYNNLTREEYSDLLKKKEFWNLFNSQKIFIHQEDSIVFKDNIDEFLYFDYVGAPWIDFKVGNGGCSLRTREVMLKCIDISNNEFNNDLEDKFFCNSIEKYKLGLIPTFEKALEFGEEYVNSYNIPFCGHQFWRSGNVKLDDIKEIKYFDYLNYK